MEKYDVYKDIAERCDGDIYIGVVGPVRTGKSTFITKFMESVVLPNITNKNVRERVKDELPQSGSGKAVMTTEPKFVPSESVEILLDNQINMSVRLVDCVGYLVDGVAIGEEEGEIRMVKTPWSDEPMPFVESAEMGTSKVINEHANLAILVTTDGSITELPRENYIQAEERVAEELKSIGKPYIIVLNSKTPTSEFCDSLKKSLEFKYSVPVIAMNLANMDSNAVTQVIETALMEFPLKKVEIALPEWIQALPFDSEMIKDVMSCLTDNVKMNNKMTSYKSIADVFDNSKYFTKPKVEVAMGSGAVQCQLTPVDGLFYSVLSNECGVEIKDDFELVSALKELVTAKQEYDKIKTALFEVKETGYGVVSPSIMEMEIDEPEKTQSNGQYGIKIKATAPSIHMMRVDVDTEINPIIGAEQQGEEMVKNLINDFEKNPESIWNANIFGKSLDLVVNDGLNNKIQQMPIDVKRKMRKTVSRIVNEGRGGVICILL